jgi:GT2 family glycosyltransferase
LPDISVVIPSRDRRGMLLEALDALANQTLAWERYEVIPVVDGSADGTAEALRDLTVPYRLRPIVQPPRGRAAACNAGIRAAEASIVVLLDDDMLPTASFLEAHLQAHRGPGRRGVLGPVPIVSVSGRNAAARYVAKKFERHLARLDSGTPIGFRELYTGNFSAHAADLRAAGLFDESFAAYGNEDGELGIRLLDSGVQLGYEHAALAWQRYTKTFANLAVDNEAKGRTAVMLSRRHPRAMSELKLSQRASRRLRLGRASLFLFSRLDRRSSARLVAAFRLLELLSPSLAEYLCPAILDHFYWRGARSESARLDAAADGEALPERRRNARLRSVDWRFLLPDPSPEIAVCFDRRLRVATELVAGRVLSPIEATRGCDLAVLVDPDVPRLSAARQALKSGGVCYVEVGPRLLTRSQAIKHRLEEAGFDSVQTYWPWPNPRAAHVWLPMDSRGPVRYYIATRATRRGVVRRSLHAFGHVLAACAVRVGAAPVIVAVARNPVAEAAEGHSTTASLHLLLTGGPRSISKAVTLNFANEASTPSSVVKMSRTPEARAGLMREVEMLRFLERERPDLTGVPHVVDVEDARAARVVETPVVGKPMHGDLRNDTLDRHAALVTDWVTGLARRDRTPSSDTVGPDLIDAIKAGFRHDHRTALTDREWQECEAYLSELDGLPAVPEHRDLGPWNIFLGRDGVGVIDWESAVPRGLPALDLIYFLVYASGYALHVLDDFGLIEVYRAVRDPRTRLGSLATDALRRYCFALDLDLGQLPALHLLTWMVHARSEYRRATEDAGALGPPRIADRGLFLGLWRAELSIAREADLAVT